MNNIAQAPSLQVQFLAIDGKKLTKSLFNQIDFADCFTSKIDFTGD
jgi:uncharacterized protein YccT (UPF0319 family)